MVPVAMEQVRRDVYSREFGITYFDAFRIAPGVPLRMYFQPGLSLGGTDQVHDHLMAGERDGPASSWKCGRRPGAQSYSI